MTIVTVVINIISLKLTQISRNLYLITKHEMKSINCYTWLVALVEDDREGTSGGLALFEDGRLGKNGGLPLDCLGTHEELPWFCREKWMLFFIQIYFISLSSYFWWLPTPPLSGETHSISKNNNWENIPSSSHFVAVRISVVTEGLVAMFSCC